MASSSSHANKQTTVHFNFTVSLSLSLARDEYLFYPSTGSLSWETPTDPSRFLSLVFFQGHLNFVSWPELSCFVKELQTSAVATIHVLLSKVESPDDIICRIITFRHVSLAHRTRP